MIQVKICSIVRFCKIDTAFIRFVIVGIINTMFGTTIMFVLYNVFHQSYWVSSAANYFLGSILSYILNKYITFKYKGWDVSSVLKFSINIIVCYIIAYGIAKPLIEAIFEGFAKSIQENIALFVGMCVFVFINYFGQRLFVFKKRL